MKDLPHTLEKKTLIDGFVTLERETLLYDGQHQQDFFRIRTRRESVCILPFYERNDRILLLLEYRHAVQETLLAAPGGFLEEGENATSAAERELLEECGCRAERFIFLGSAYPLPGIMDQKIHFVRAEGITHESEPTLEVGECLETITIEMEQLNHYLLQEKVDGVLLSALHFNSLHPYTNEW